MSLRLTLRTLLAYRDGVLPQADQRDLALRIEKNPNVKGLLARLDAVEELKRFSRSRLQQARLDANELAGYLDDALTPDQVANIESTLLEDDYLLAEVVAAHRIVTRDLSQTSTQPSEPMRERLYELFDEATSTTKANSQESVDHSKNIKKPNRGRRRRPVTTSDRPPLLWKIAAGSIVLLLLIVGGMVWATLWSANVPHTMVANKSTKNSNDSLNHAEVRGQRPGGTNHQTTKSAKPKTSNKTNKAKSSKTSKKPEVGPEPKVEDEPKQPPGPDDNPKVIGPTWNEPKIKAVLPTVVYSKPPFSVDAFVPLATYASPDGMFFRQNHAGTNRLGPGDALFADDLLVTPLGSRAQLNLVDGSELTLLPRTRCEPTVKKNADVSLRLDQGKVVLQTAGKPLKLVLEFQGDSYWIDIQEEKTVLEIEARLGKKLGPIPPETVDELERLLLVFVAQGKIKVTEPGKNQPTEFGPGKQIVGDHGRWKSDRDLGRPIAPVAMDAKKMTRSAVLLDQELSVGDHAVLRLRKLARDQHQAVHPLAELTLADLGDDVTVWNLFSRPEDAGASETLAPILVAVLRYQLALDAGRENALNRRLRDLDQADRLHYVTLLKGFSKRQFSNPEVKQYLTELMNSDRRALRWLAWWNVREWADDNLPYHPDSPARERTKAVNDWKKHWKLEKNNG